MTVQTCEQKSSDSMSGSNNHRILAVDNELDILNRNYRNNIVVKLQAAVQSDAKHIEVGIDSLWGAA